MLDAAPSLMLIRRISLRLAYAAERHDDTPCRHYAGAADFAAASMPTAMLADIFTPRRHAAAAAIASRRYAFRHASHAC